MQYPDKYHLRLLRFYLLASLSAYIPPPISRIVTECAGKVYEIELPATCKDRCRMLTLSVLPNGLAATPLFPFNSYTRALEPRTFRPLICRVVFRLPDSARLTTAT